MNERDIFLAALEISDPAERAAYIDQACAGDAKLRAQVAQLLRTHEQTSGFLETPTAAGQSVIDETIASDSATAGVELSQRASGEAAFRKYLEPSTRPGWLGRLGHYEVEAILGQGAFGIVAKAFDEKLHRVVAIKMLAPELATISPPRKRFLREARSAAAVPHENLVGIFAVEDEPIPYLVMEYIPGDTLQARLDQNGPLDLPDILRIGQQLAAGMAAAHTANLIHRDIKPSNILLTDGPHERVKISDFGLARAVDDASMTSSGMITGTPLYMAPEQARGETLDHRADLFSMGSVLYQMASGHPPFRAPNTVAVLKRVCEDTPRPITDVIPGTPVWLCAIIERLLEKNPDDRLQTAQEVADLLARCQKELELNGKVTCVNELIAERQRRAKAKTQPAASSGASKTPWLVGGAVAALALIIAAIVYFNRDTGSGTSVADTNNEITSNGANEATPNTVTNIEPVAAQGWHGWPADAPRPAIAPFDADQARVHQEAWAKYLGVPEEYENSIGMKFRLIPPGEFMMGSAPEELEAALKVAEDESWRERINSEGPQHKVILTQPVYVGVTEVTQSQYERVMGTNPSHFSATGEGKDTVANLETGNHPVEKLRWSDAAEFCAILSQQEQLKPFYFRSVETITPLDGTGYRLPTEAEWEHACRAGTTTRFWSGHADQDLSLAGWHKGNSGGGERGRTHAVGELQANPFGLYDTHGNVWEWVQDGWEPAVYAKNKVTPAINPSVPFADATHRVVRGGRWSFDPSRCRSSFRFAEHSTSNFGTVGFRVVLPVDAVRQSLTRNVASGAPVTSPSDDVPSSPADPYARDRAVAEWVLEQGGRVRVIPPGNTFIDVSERSALPPGDWSLNGAYLEKCEIIRSEELSRLAALPSLVVFSAPTNLDSRGLSRVLQNPSLTFAILGYSELRSGDLAQLEQSTALVVLHVSSEQVDDQWAFLRRLKSVRQLLVYGHAIPALTKLASATQLHTVELPLLESLDASVVREIQSVHPQLRIVVGRGSQSMVVGRDPVREAGKALAARGWQFEGVEFRGGESWTSNSNDAWQGNRPIEITKVILPTGTSLTTEEVPLLRRLSFTFGLFAPELKKADGLGDALEQVGRVTSLDLSGSDLRDVGLLRLARLPHLRDIVVTGTGISQSGLAEFKRRLPTCKIRSDFGTFEYEHKLPEGWGSEPSQPSASVTPPADPYARDREAAEWVLSVGGSVNLLTSMVLV